MTIASHGHEHEFEPQYGLPEALPAGERILWQGAPHFPTLARKVFHVRKAAVYFAVLLALALASHLNDGQTPAAALTGLLLPLALALGALAALTALAWWTARTTVYTLTDKRIVLRVGIVLTLTFNLPLRLVESAALRAQPGGTGDIVIALGGGDHIAWLHLWPHVRPWRLTRTEPMLRAVPDAPAVAAVLMQAWSRQTGVALVSAQPGAAPAQDSSGRTSPRWQTSPT
jgi:Bacterial PH domain